MSAARDLNVGHRSFSEPPTPRVRLTHRHIHFLKRPSELALRATVVVGFTHRNHPEGLRGALHSALQQVINQQIALLVLDDSSDEGLIHSLDAALLSDPRIAIAVGRLGSPAQARNGVLDLVELAYPCARWVARMDADDRFATPGSLQALVQAGDAGDCHFVVGSNRLSVDGVELADVNWASPSILLNRRSLNVFIQAFCRQQVPQELPSCNLLLRVGSGIRYPYAVSAEDHWLVAGLLMHRSQDGCVVTDPPYALYSLGGEMTRVNQKGEFWKKSRLALAQAADSWSRVHEIPGAKVLGWGQEGVVWCTPEGIYKRFYPYAMSAGDLLQVKRLADAAGDAVIAFEPCEDGGEGLLIKLDSEPLLSLGRRWPLALSHRLLLKLYRSGVITSNMKRDNLRLTRGGELQYIDIGRDIVPLTASRFLDCAARLYAIGELGWSDHEMARRKTVERQADALEVLSGFSAFYGALIRSLHPACELQLHERSTPPKPPDHEDVTLLIKCCPQDAKSVDAQVRHLVSELRIRARFGKTILLADPFEGPYLRQYDKGSLSLLRSAVDRLQAAGWVDEVWWAETDPDVIADINRRWFSEADVTASHTVQGAPLFSQLWAFDRVETPYVLQMDVDVLIGGTDSRHDVIADMKRACMASDVWCVGFNIPQTRTGFKPYAGEPDSYAPEVRCGLLHLEKIRSRTPFVNPLNGERLTWMWHRAMRHAQPLMGMRSVRGGDSRTFYVHPKNEDKDAGLIERVRDLIGKGWIPGAQQGAWDLDTSSPWSYPKRGEDVVFLLFGRETPPVKLERCLSSLRAQSDQQFGVVIIDDAGDTNLAVELPHRLAWLRERVTLIRRSTRVGYMTNFREAVERVCTNPDTLLVVLDQDDALMHTNVVQQLKAACMGGADLINAPMFRPEKPTTLYEVSHELPRQRGGGNVWSHLRAFRKRLFEQVPEQVWSIAPDPDCLSDFLTMVPMTELAKHPMFLDGPYAYWHERLPYSDDRKAREATMKAWLFSQPSLAQNSQR